MAFLHYQTVLPAVSFFFYNLCHFCDHKFLYLARTNEKQLPHGSALIQVPQAGLCESSVILCRVYFRCKEKNKQLTPFRKERKEINYGVLRNAYCNFCTENCRYSLQQRRYYPEEPVVFRIYTGRCRVQRCLLKIETTLWRSARGFSLCR